MLTGQNNNRGGNLLGQTSYRILTRGDFDGLVSASLLRELGMCREIKLVHPKDMQDGKVMITDRDIATNLPYVEGVHMAFGHYVSEMLRVGKNRPNHVNDPYAPSTARVVYNHYGGKIAFPKISDDLMMAVDRADSAQFSIDEVLQPSEWSLLHFLLDSRTGLGRFSEFSNTNQEMLLSLVDAIRQQPIDELLSHPDIQERVDFYFSQQSLFEQQLMACTEVEDNVAILDLRNEDPIYAGNRFMIYALNPLANVSIHVLWGPQKRNTVIAVGRSIFDRSLSVNIGKLMLEFGGGGRGGAGTCQVPNEQAEVVLRQIITRLQF
jgi:nanoRNase/pAp phosphatase (c-di-AMP/oligoRNAs hydrolase)